MRRVLINIVSDSLGDTIACVPYVSEYQRVHNVEVLQSMNPAYIFLFENSYPNVKFVDRRNSIEFDERIDLVFFFSKTIQGGYAEQLGFQNPKYIKPVLKVEMKDRPIKNKFISIGTQSTAQLKYWNHPSGIKSQSSQPYWDELCKILRKKSYTPVCIDRESSFGKPPFFNNTPKNSVNRTGLSLLDTVNYLHHSEFFIGLSSGLSWLAHALGKKVVMISNFSEDWCEFDLSDVDSYIRITNKSVCHGCFNKCDDEFVFDAWDWYFCPKHKGTERQFECHTSITPQDVIEKIDCWL